MELMLVLAFLFVLLCYGLKNKSVSFVSKINRGNYKSWVDGITNPEYEEVLRRAFTNRLDTEDAQRIREEYKRISDLNPCCARIAGIPWNAEDWEIPIMLAVRGKLPTYHLKYSSFDRREYPGGEMQLRMLKWVESTLRSQGINVTLYACGVCGHNMRLIDDIKQVTTTGLAWRGTDSRGEIIEYI